MVSFSFAVRAEGGTRVRARLRRASGAVIKTASLARVTLCLCTAARSASAPPPAPLIVGRCGFQPSGRLYRPSADRVCVASSWLFLGTAGAGMGAFGAT